MSHEKWLEEAVQLAVQSVEDGGGPFAAIVVKNGKRIGSGMNVSLIQHDPTAHAELLAIRDAAGLIGSVDLSGAILYASGEPCVMCTAAAYWAHIKEIYYACSRNKAVQIVDLRNPMQHFFADLEKEPERRSVPFVHQPTNNAASPFKKWAEAHK
ncbi:nucleoside deaminase [Sporosarcina sp. FSL W7-1349]|uniref:nucleoside deaminase n=1 Tax=Sporosarcina sp. FSL W7-1349 TaxID=2921561 RepID=UPI0030FCF526